MKIKQGYRIELSPTAEQRQILARHAGLSRVVENFCLAVVKAALSQRDAEKTYGVPADELTNTPWSAIDLEKRWRAQHADLYPWFKDSGMSSRVPKEACRMRASGLKQWADSRSGRRKGRRTGFPKWRTRKHGSRFRYDADCARPATSQTVHLPAVGKVATREKMTWLTDRIGDGRARIIGSNVREQAGRWWVSFNIEVDRGDINDARRVVEDAPSCGVDLGIKTFAVIVDDTGQAEEIRSSKPLKTAQRRLRQANKALARTRPGSANRAKARKRVAAIHLKVTHRRNDFLNKLTTRLARSKRAIAVETLNVAGMVRNRRLARAVSDAGFGEFFRQLAYKTTWYGSSVWAADMWFPSSRTCSDCGAINAGLTLSDRSWICTCGSRHDRDHNAARNLLAAMQSSARETSPGSSPETLTAHGGDVRPRLAEADADEVGRVCDPANGASRG